MAVLKASTLAPLMVALVAPAPAAALFGTTPRGPPNAPTPSPGSGSPVSLLGALVVVMFIANRPAPAAIPPDDASDGTMATVGVVTV